MPFMQRCFFLRSYWHHVPEFRFMSYRKFWEERLLEIRAGYGYKGGRREEEKSA